jgi:hypothetical protein
VWLRGWATPMSDDTTKVELVVSSFSSASGKDHRVDANTHVPTIHDTSSVSSSSPSISASHQAELAVLQDHRNSLAAQLSSMTNRSVLESSIQRLTMPLTIQVDDNWSGYSTTLSSGGEGGENVTLSSTIEDPFSRHEGWASPANYLPSWSPITWIAIGSLICTGVSVVMMYSALFAIYATNKVSFMICYRVGSIITLCY